MAELVPIAGIRFVRCQDRRGGGVEVEIIPEPASLIVWLLLGVLGITFGWRRRRRRRADH